MKNIKVIILLVCNLFLCSCMVENNTEINLNLENLNTDNENINETNNENGIILPDDPSAIKFLLSRKLDSKNNLNTNFIKNYKGIKLNAYNGMFGSYGEENIFQKEIRIEENGNDFKVTITPLKDLINRLREEVELLSDDDMADFSLRYNFHFSSKDDALYFLENFEEYTPNSYELKEINKTSDGVEYKYDSVTTEQPFVYSLVNNPNKTVKAINFNKLKEKLPNELKDITCIKCDKTLQAKFYYKDNDEELTLNELQQINDGEFKNLSLNNNGKEFSYTKEEENKMFNDPQLLESYTTSDDPEIKKEKLIKNELTLNFLGNGVNLSYADYGYWKEKGYYESVIDGTISERESIAIPLIGGISSLEKFEDDLNTKTTFEGKVVANVKEVNKDNVTLKGNISYTIDKTKTEENGMKEFNVEIPDWYHIDIVSTGNGYSDWTFLKNATMDENLPFIRSSNLDGEKKGYIRDIKYYGNAEDLESVGVLEYIDKFNTDLTLTYGVKK